MPIKYKKLKRLRKISIIPSILFLFITIFFADVAFKSLLSFMLSAKLNERIETESVKASYIFSQFDSSWGREGVLLDTLQKKGQIKDSFFVYDSEGNAIVSVGEETYYKKKIDDIMTIEQEDGYDIYIDTSKDNILDSKGMPKNLCDNKRFAKMLSDRCDSDDTFKSAYIWLKTDLAKDRTAIIRCTVDLTLKDYIYGFTAGVISVGLFAVPLTLMLINILINFAHNSKMRQLLYTSPITGDNNFLYFENYAGKELRSKPQSYFVTDLTLMKYRSYCNYHGIHAGEDLLTRVNDQLKLVVTKKEIVAFHGKSSFALLLKFTDMETAQKRVGAIINGLSQKYSKEGIIFHCGICLAVNPNVPLTKQDRKKIDAADVYSRAGAARASLQDENTNGIAVYNEKLLEEQIWEHRVNEKMVAALKNEEFFVYIQPKYDPVTEKLNGAEALVRWINKEDGFISPGRFIPIFEKNGFITKLDDYMLDKISQLQALWISQGKEVVPISVNISRAHFADPGLAEHICGIVDRYGVPHGMIEIELTESAFFDDKEMLLNTVGKLRDLGFEISMDDFGAGYSSLNSLKDLPLDVLKLDADFFRGENSRERGEIVVSQAITLAKKLNMKIVAEGIEHREQVDFLAKHGCDMIQGFYFAKPMPAEEYAERLTSDAEKILTEP